MKNIRELIAKAKVEMLDESDISYVAKKLGDCQQSPDEDLYDYIYILGRGLYDNPLRFKYVELVEYFLYHPYDSFTAGLALNVLCSYWNFTNDYLDVLKQFIRGVDWDTDGEVKGKAITLGGSYLKNNFDKGLLSLLIDIFDKNDPSDEIEDFKRLEAYIALGLAQGLDWSELPPYSARLSDLETRGLVDLSVVENARQLLKKS